MQVQESLIENSSVSTLIKCASDFSLFILTLDALSDSTLLTIGEERESLVVGELMILLVKVTIEYGGVIIWSERVSRLWRGLL